MAKLFPKLVSFLAVLLLCQFGYVACQSTNPSDRNATLPEDEATALDDLMTTLGGDLLLSSPCDNNYQGINCNCSYHNNSVCHVTGLDLSNQELDGRIDAEALASLVHLEEIDLSSNELDGSIPDVIMGSLPSLTYLDLSDNFLSGSIPLSLGSLSSLGYM
ncbi:hypothetical protein NC653_035757 [Populus alba x Populus x berolinensis]|uniref:Uncharacterized protein n=1 Tax=Populus alba x Populus x berolinensis TaxID=444605 RepID=A0AAD6LID1_9ROSI|nr:hypothetical protein NC653_035757 [Populus alba x Populus x berolinensis]